MQGLAFAAASATLAAVFGVQVRGRKAANAQIAFMLLSLLAVAVSIAWKFLVFIVMWPWRLLVMAWQLMLLIPYAWEQLKRSVTSWRIQRVREQLPVNTLNTLQYWDVARLIAALTLVSVGWGQGRSIMQARPELERQLSLQRWSLC